MFLKQAVALLLTLSLMPGSLWADYRGRADTEAFVKQLVEEDGFDATAVRTVLGQAQRKEAILEAIARPAERRLKWHEYRKIFIKESSIESGLKFWQDNADTLARAEQVYGVPAKFIVAIIGVETRWGRIMGKYRVIDALATLGFDYPPRAKFFRGQLRELLLLAREESKSPDSFTGSYAGAMGYGQFIPSSFRSFAVDFDNDGVRDIWANPVDAIGSVANYFAKHGWRKGEPVVLNVTVDDPAKVDAIANESLKLNQDLGGLRALGVNVDDATGANAKAAKGLAQDTKAALFRMEQEETQEYWLGLQNFYTITRYNHSRLYALAVFQLGEAIGARQSVTVVTRGALGG